MSDKPSTFTSSTPNTKTSSSKPEQIPFHLSDQFVHNRFAIPIFSNIRKSEKSDLLIVGRTMANDPAEGYGDEFMEQILAIPSYGGSHLGETTSSGVFRSSVDAGGVSWGLGGRSCFEGSVFSFGLSLESRFPLSGAGDVALGRAVGGQPAQLGSMYTAFGHIQPHSMRVQPGMQQFNQADKAAMLDEILDYVKFLRLQMKREVSEGGSNQKDEDKWSTDEIEQEVARLMDENVGAAMQLLQSKSLCIMPISLAATIFPAHQSEPSTDQIKSASLLQTSSLHL